MDFLNAIKRGRPAVVGGQICCHQLKTGVVHTTAAHGPTHTCLTIQGPHRRAHLAPITQQRSDVPR
jgi:hypothetical protein